MFEPQQPRVTPHTWNNTGDTGALIDIPGFKGRGLFIPGAFLDDVIDALVDIADPATA